MWIKAGFVILRFDIFTLVFDCLTLLLILLTAGSNSVTKGKSGSTLITGPCLVIHVPGSSPSGSREFEVGMALVRSENNCLIKRLLRI